MELKKFKYLFVTGVTMIFIVILFNSLNYVENEGFNPTDEGVVLAQSWRIINGQIPHKDFISIRPAFSGYLHTINFIFPGALVCNARWFVLFQFFLIAAVLSVFVCKEFERDSGKKINMLYFASFLIISFIVTVFNFIVYPWTTIDAVFWAVLALPLLFSDRKWKISIGLIFLALAALSRQTYGLLVVIANLYTMYRYRKNLLKIIPYLLISIVPFLVYMIMLILNSAFSDFLIQMTGRSGFFQTAILQYFKKVVSSYSTPLNFLVIVLSGFIIFGRKRKIREKIIEKGIHNIVVYVYVFFIIGMLIRHFMIGRMDIYQLPFSLFYSTIALTVFHYALFPKKIRQRLISVSVLMVAWISSISLGANAPVFVSGPLLIILILLFVDIYLFKHKESGFSKVVVNSKFVFVFSITMLGLGVYGQQSVNYRDVPWFEQSAGISEASLEFGNIRTNKDIKLYYIELANIFHNLPNSLNHTVVFPHNAMFYPLMKTINPAPLDWLIPNEYVGLEERVKRDFLQLTSQMDLYFIVDKVDVRIINIGVSPREYENFDIIYNIIVTECKRLPIESQYFDVYKTKNVP